jgi:D-alanyl-D-alanine carboxypeptidase
MKKLVLVFVLGVLGVAGVAQPVNAHFSRAAALTALLQKYTQEGLPGAAVAVYSEQEGWWAGSAGYASLEKKTVMTTDHLQYLQSVSKTYMAVAILKLYEEGRIRLDAPITNYLPARYGRQIQEASAITVRMLLNHTSGIPEYSTDPGFVAFVVLHPTMVFDAAAALPYIGHTPPLFPPGSKHSYANTNYLLLALIADSLTGDHAKYIREKIFTPLGLEHTFYHGSKGYLHYPMLTDSYWDVLNVGRPANISAFQQANVATLKGDDGVVCTPLDAVRFLKGLTEGKLLRDSTFRLMQQWVNNEKGQPQYGLGLVYYAAGGLTGYGHSGAGVGAGCILIYVPERKTYVFMATNVSTLVEGDMAKKADALKDEILAALLF